MCTIRCRYYMMTSSDGNIFALLALYEGNPMDSPHKDQWRGVWCFLWTNRLRNNRDADYLGIGFHWQNYAFLIDNGQYICHIFFLFRFILNEQLISINSDSRNLAWYLWGIKIQWNPSRNKHDKPIPGLMETLFNGWRTCASTGINFLKTHRKMLVN